MRHFAVKVCDNNTGEFLGFILKETYHRITHELSKECFRSGRGWARRLIEGFRRSYHYRSLNQPLRFFIEEYTFTCLSSEEFTTS